MDLGVGMVLTQRNGVREWIFQRVSNVLIIAYAIVYLSLIAFNDNWTYESWLAMHDALWFKAYSTATLIFAILNSILAGWQIGTDYVQKVPFAWFGPFYTTVYWLGTLYILLLALFILWGM